MPRSSACRLLLGVVACLAAAVCGCAPFGPAPRPTIPNPLFISARDPEFLWQQTVEVVDSLFTIEDEERVRQLGTTQTVGRIDTFPVVGATIFEPWLGDSVGRFQRWESTLQTIRRRAAVQVIPSDGGYLVDVSVFKELEDVTGQSLVTAGGSTLRTDNSLQRYRDPIGGQPTSEGWIAQGRDTELEQRMLGMLMARLQPGPYRGPIGFVPAGH